LQPKAGHAKFEVGPSTTQNIALLEEDIGSPTQAGAKKTIEEPQDRLDFFSSMPLFSK
jgi:hypothetical protein